MKFLAESLTCLLKQLFLATEFTGKILYISNSRTFKYAFCIVLETLFYFIKSFTIHANKLKRVGKKTFFPLISFNI
jgi:hypothetical protein